MHLSGIIIGKHTSSNTTGLNTDLFQIPSIQHRVKMCNYFREMCTACNVYLQNHARLVSRCTSRAAANAQPHPAGANNTTIGRAKCATCATNDPWDAYNKPACWHRHKGQLCYGRSAGGGPNCALPTTTHHGR